MFFYLLCSLLHPFFFNSVRQIYKADKIDRPDRMFGRSTFSNHTKIYRNRLMMSESSVVGADLSRTDPLRSDDHSNFLYCFFFCLLKLKRKLRLITISISNFLKEKIKKEIYLLTILFLFVDFFLKNIYIINYK